MCHFHVCVVDGVFEEVAGDCDVQAAAPGVVFHPGGGIDGGAVLEVQATLRRRILRAFVGRGMLESFEAKEMLAYKHSGFSVDAGVRIEAHDRACLERAAHYLWAVLMARIYEVFPLLCPICGGPMRIIAFITHSADIRQILDHIGADCEPPRIAPARGPPLWDECDAMAAEGWHWPMGRDPIVLGLGKEVREKCEKLKHGRCLRL